MNPRSMNGTDTAQNLLTLTCPSCGSKLKVTEKVHLLVCANCGNEHMVHRDGGAIYLAPIAQDVRQIRVGVDKTAAELAVVRLTKEIAITNDEIGDAKKQDYGQFVAKSKGEEFLLLGAITIGILVLGCLAAGQHAVVLVLVILLFSFAILHVSAGKKRQAKIDILRNAEIQRLESILFTKKAALRKQHQIASS